MKCGGTTDDLFYPYVILPKKNKNDKLLLHFPQRFGILRCGLFAGLGFGQETGKK
jgi:hypothetical protein